MAYTGLFGKTNPRASTRYLGRQTGAGGDFSTLSDLFADNGLGVGDLRRGGLTIGPKTEPGPMPGFYSDPIPGATSTTQFYNRLDQWWDQPTLQWNTPGGYPARSADDRTAVVTTPRGNPITFTPEVPDWAQNEFSDPRVFYDWWRGMSPEEQSRAQAAMSAGNTARQREEAARQAAIDELSGARTTVDDRYRAFLEDSQWHGLVDSFEATARGENPVVTGKELTAAQLGLGQRHATQEATETAGAGARGVESGTNLAERLTATSTYADAAGLSVEVQAQAANRQAEMRARVDLARVLGSREQIGQAYIDEMNRISTGIAALKAGGDFTPTDLLAFDQLSFAMNAFEEELERALANEEEYRESAETGFMDYAQLAIQGYPLLAAFLG